MGKNWDGTETLGFVFDDGGRTKAGFRGRAGDCVARSIAIASQRPYAEVYKALAAGSGSEKDSRGASARNGIRTSRKWFKEYMSTLGFRWVPTMRVGQGCTTHLLKSELPAGRLVVAVSKHYTAVIDGVIHDTDNPTRARVAIDSNVPKRLRHRCVYGYWVIET